MDHKGVVAKEMAVVILDKNSTLIKISNMKKNYIMGEIEVTALKDINIEIARKEFVSIIGPSGSGKSTLMNMIGCLDIPTSGQYTLNNKEVSKLCEDELAEIRNFTIGFVFQKFNLLPKLSAIENVQLPLLYQGINPKEAYKRAEVALGKVGLSDRIHHRPSELSGGQQQRVAIARAIVGSPPLILADEPTGALDSKTGIEVIQILRELHIQGNTIILITHDSNVANVADRTINISDGEILSDTGVK